MSITNGVLTILPPPEGYIVDFDDPARNGNIAGSWITGIGIVLSTSVLAIRMYTKVFIIKDFSLNDATLLASYVFGIAVQSILTHFWIVEASGVHAWEMPMARYQYFSTVIMVASVLYVPCLGFAKFSILFLYRKISQLRWFNVCIYILMTIVVCYSIGVIFALIFPCQPIPANWDLSVSGKCIDKAAIYLATAAVNVITDFLILTLPLPMVLRLHMPRGKKIGLVILFVVGSATLVTSIIRLVLMIPMVQNVDQTWVVSVPCIWINIEANLVIICVSLPTLRRFIKHVAPGWMGDGSQGSSAPSYLKKSSRSGSLPISRSKNSKYGRMDDSILEMADNFDDNTEADETGQDVLNNDNSSGRAVRKTTTVYIKYDQRDAP